MTDKTSPQFLGRPVIVIHLGTDDTQEGRNLAACCGEYFLTPDNSYPNIPMVPCIGCLNAMKKET